MGEVAELFDVNPSLIRHWESKFDVLRPHKNKKGNRMFSPQDVDNLRLIYHLVKERGMTLEGANRSLKRNRGHYMRDAELLERLQRVRGMLLEVREELRTDEQATLLEEEPEAAVQEVETDGAATAPESEPGPSPVGRTVQTAEVRGAVFPSVDPVHQDAVTGCPTAQSAAAATEPDEHRATTAESPVSILPATEAAACALTASSDDARFEPTDPAQATPGQGNEIPLPDMAPACATAPTMPHPDSAPQPGLADGAGPLPAVRRPRRRRDDEGDKELFAFYEQSLF